MPSFKGFKLKLRFHSTKLSSNVRRLIRLAPQKAVQAMYTSATHVFVPAIRARIKDQNLVFQGELFKRISVQAIVQGTNSGVKVGAIGVPYSLAVEQGAPPHEPDMEKLIRYARLKRGAKNPEKTARRIAMTIRTKGTKPHPFLQPALESEWSRFLGDYHKRATVILSSL
jgi:hypothetical protein